MKLVDITPRLIEKYKNRLLKRVKMFRETSPRVRYLELDEIDALISECSTDMKPLVVMTLNTGMRYREITGMRWNDIDMRNRVIMIPDSKSGKPREVPMRPAVSVLLQSPPRRSELVFVV